MSNERPDEFLSWRTHLGQPDALPEQGLDDREASWEKLADRFREKPRRWTGYWIAAACLVLALAPIARLFKDRPVPVALHPSVQRQTVPEKLAGDSRRKAEKSRVVPADPLSAAIVRTERTRTPRTRAQKTRAERAKIAPSRPAAVIHLPGIAGSGAHPTLPAYPVILPATDAANRLIAQQPAPKKSLRVVHLNEINPNTGQTPSMSTGYSGHFRIELGSLGLTPSADPAARPDNGPLLKINLSSQNP